MLSRGTLLLWWETSGYFHIIGHVRDTPGIFMVIKACLTNHQIDWWLLYFWRFLPLPSALFWNLAIFQTEGIGKRYCHSYDGTCPGLFQLSPSHNLTSPWKVVSMRNYLDHVGMWACLWGIILILNWEYPGHYGQRHSLGWPLSYVRVKKAGEEASM